MPLYIANQARRTQQALKKGSHNKKAHRAWTTVSFKRPVTKHLARNPKYARQSVEKAGRINDYSIVEYPLPGEAASKLMEDHNTLVFIVKREASKTNIRDSLKQKHKVEIKKINTLIRPDGRKKAFVTFVKDNEAIELGSKIGIV